MTSFSYDFFVYVDHDLIDEGHFDACLVWKLKEFQEKTPMGKWDALEISNASFDLGNSWRIYCTFHKDWNTTMKKRQVENFAGGCCRGCGDNAAQASQSSQAMHFLF